MAKGVRGVIRRVSLTLYATLSFAPQGLDRPLLSECTAYPVGCKVSPLRGCNRINQAIIQSPKRVCDQGNHETRELFPRPVVVQEDMESFDCVVVGKADDNLTSG